MFWALARASFRAAKIVSCNKKFFFLVYDQNYHNCSSLRVQKCAKTGLKILPVLTREQYTSLLHWD
jgi:hypothetical protein